MTLGTAKKCGRCEAEVSVDALWGLCHKCLYDEVTQMPAGEGVLSAQNRRFGDYQLGQQLGRGGMGVVYEAVQISLRRPVALKMILDIEATSPTSLRRFTLEAEAAAKLDHPNIVPIYEIGEHEGQPFLSMKFIAGDNLRKKIASGELCLALQGQSISKADLRERAATVARFMATIARAVHHAHQNGVLHRDLKPGNILVDGQGQPHLTDFGLAKMMDSGHGETPVVALTVSGTALGTPSYMSPEQASGQRLSASSDIYSLGAILYEMLTGEPPFKAGTLLETLRLLAEQEAKRPSIANACIDKDLDTICMKCLEKNPDSRYQTAEALASDLERWIGHETIQARPAGMALRVRRWVKRNRVGTALIVSLLGSLGTALVLLQMAWARQHALEVQRANYIYVFTQEVQTLWDQPDREFVPIYSSQLATLANTEPRATDPGAVKLTMGMSVSDNPANQAETYARLLGLLEEKMERLLGRRVVIDLRLYKLSGGSGPQPVVSGQVDFQRLGPLAYVRAKQSVRGLEPLVQERNNKHGVLFTWKGSGITNLSQVAGHRVAFAHTNSIISFLAKVQLARAGIVATNLKYFENLDRLEFEVTRAAKVYAAGEGDIEPGFYAHREVLRKVLTHEFDVGEAERRHFERHRTHGLEELLSYSVPSDVYVASARVDPKVILALRKTLGSLTSEKEKTMLGRLQATTVEGFEPVTDHDFNELRRALTNEVQTFEAGVRANVSDGR